MGYLLRKIQGVGGTVDVPRLGVPIAEISNWTLSRRGGEEPGTDEEASFFDLHAILARFTQAIFDDPEYDKRVILVMRGQRYLVRQAPGQRMVLTGRSLVMDRVEIDKI